LVVYPGKTVLIHTRTLVDLKAMNGQNRYELAGDLMEEYAALDNRSVVLLNEFVNTT